MRLLFTRTAISGNYTYRLLQNTAVSAQTVYLCVSHESQNNKKKIVSLNRAVGFVMEIRCVFCEVGTEILNNLFFRMNFRLCSVTNSSFLPDTCLSIYRWLRHYATSRNVAGSIPDEVFGPGIDSAGI
jgi:hypothetical protein